MQNDSFMPYSPFGETLVWTSPSGSYQVHQYDEVFVLFETILLSRGRFASLDEAVQYIGGMIE